MNMEQFIHVVERFSYLVNGEGLIILDAGIFKALKFVLRPTRKGRK